MIQTDLLAALKSADDLLTSGNELITDGRKDFLETLSSLRRSMWEAEVAMRKIRANPGVVLWGDDEKLLSAWPTDPSSLRRAGRAPPYQQRDENDKK